MNPSEGVRNYQYLSGLGLGVLFLLQVQQDLQTRDPQVQLALGFLSVCMLLAGTLGILAWSSVSPLFVLFLLGASQLVQQINVGPVGQHGSALRPLDLALSMAALAYAAGHYRLLALRFRAVPVDSRLRAASAARSEHLATPGEFVSLLVQIPLFALLAQGACFVLFWRWEVPGLPPDGMQFLILVWVLVLGLFVTSHLFRYWRRRQMDVATARLLLQDVLWQETRGEQRRLERWLAWRRIKEREE